jgi:hypothetical protein
LNLSSSESSPILSVYVEELSPLPDVQKPVLLAVAFGIEHGRQESKAYPMCGEDR